METTIVGMTMNGLSHVAEVTTREEFLCGLVRGLGSNVSAENQAELSSEVFQWAMETHPDPRKPMDTYYDPNKSKFSTYHLKVRRIQLHVCCKNSEAIMELCLMNFQ